MIRTERITTVALIAYLIFAMAPPHECRKIVYSRQINQYEKDKGIFTLRYN